MKLCIILSYYYLQAISCHFATCHTNYIDVRGTVQEDLAKEVVEVAERRYPTGEWDIQVC